MKTSVESIFPTDIYTFKDVLETEYVDSMKEDIIKSSKEKDRGNWQSDSNIHQLPKYKALSEMVLKGAKYVFEDKKYLYDSFEITNMWSNVLKSGETHRPHTHSNNILSGVYYVESDEAANIRFYDPRPSAGVLVPKISKIDKTNSGLWQFKSTTNTMIMFPSWLQHFVPVNTSNKIRISIAFNVMLKGIVGDPKELQSAEF